MRLFSFGGYGLALAALALVVFGAYDSYPTFEPLEVTGRLTPVLDCSARERFRSYQTGQVILTSSSVKRG